MGVGQTREQARRDQEARDRAGKEARDRERARRNAGRRPFSWQQPGGTGRPAPQEGHRYQTCKDDDCDRFPCRVYKEGHRDGTQAGYALGWDACYPVAFAEGLASCPGPHGSG
jgi:hypothetical protein